MKIVEQNTEVGIIVARFQCPELHEGHQDIINTVRENHSRVIIFLGVSPLRCTKNNPYNFSIRRAMIEEKYEDVEVGYIDDVGDDELWSKNLDNLISKNIPPGHKATLYGSRDSFIKHYTTNKYPTVELIPNKIVSASEIRRKIAIKPLTDVNFRKGIVYAVENQFPTIHPAVDCAIIDFNEQKLLLGKKPHENKLRFPGGFIDPLIDISAEAAALREAYEETSLSLILHKYIGSTIVNDWRYAHEQNKIMTFFYMLQYTKHTHTKSTPVANDDLEFLIWKDFGQIDMNEIVLTHHPLMGMLNNELNGTVLKNK